MALYRVHDLLHHGKLVAEFATFDEAKAFVDDLDDIVIMRIEDDGPAEVVWET